MLECTRQSQCYKICYIVMRVFLGKDIRTDNRATQKLRREVEKAKRALSAAHQTRVEIESFFDGEVCNMYTTIIV